jgi:tetratricopeptide (TPR) repeat protein
MDHRGTYIKGHECFAQGYYEQALSFFLSIIDSNSNDENLLLRISQCYEQIGNNDDAIEFLERLLDVSLGKGEYKKAIAICKRILSLDPDDTEVVLKLANIFRKINQYGEATYYYKIVAQHYEYAGFMDKALEILQIIKELGQDGVEDLLEIVKNEYKRGAKAKADKNIDEIIVELKNGGEHKLLEVALNLALTSSPEKISYVMELAELYFRTQKLESCIRLCLWTLHLDKTCSKAMLWLVKSLWALGWDDYAKRLTELVISGEMETKDKDAPLVAARIREAMLAMDKERIIKVSEDLGEDELSQENLSYLKSTEFTHVDHQDIKRKLMMEELDQKIEEAQSDQTSIIDLRRKNKFPPKMLDGLKESEILVSEGMYDKAGLKLFELLEGYPGNEDLKDALNRVLKLSSVADSMPSYSGRELEQEAKTSSEMISDLERYLDQEDIAASSDNINEQEKIQRVVDMFNGRLKEVLLPEDYMTVFDLGIAYMEMELWKDAAAEFKRVINLLIEKASDNPRLAEAKIYYAYANAQTGVQNAKNSAKFLESLVQQTVNENQKLDALYYLAMCYEAAGDVNKARTSYSEIRNIDPVYRDIEIRTSVLGK